MKKFTFLIALMVFIAANVFGQTLVLNPPANNGSTTEICIGTTVSISLTGATPSQFYSLYDVTTGFVFIEQKQANASGDVSFTPITPGAIGKIDYSILSGPFVANFSIETFAQPSAPTMTKSPNQAAVCAGTNVSASVATPGSGGGIACADWYEHSTDGGSTWSAPASTPPASISTTGLSGANIVQIRASRYDSQGRGCSSGYNTVSWTVNALPIPTITGSASVCAGSIETYTTETGMTGYTWTVTGGTGSSTTSSISITWGAAGAGQVTVNYTNAASCTATSATVKPITINALPIPTISGPASVCAGSIESYTTETGMTGYTWTVTGGTGSSTTSSISITWGAAGAGQVTVNYTNAALCTATSATVNPVTINALPIPTISGPATVCANSTQTYTTESGMTNYAWTIVGGTGSSTTNTINVTWGNFLGAASVSVNYTDINGCTAAIPNKSVLVDKTGGATDLLLKLGDKTSGVYNLNFNMYVPTGYSGYYNILHIKPPSVQWAIEVYFRATGTGFINAGGNNAATFTYPLDTWVPVVHMIDLDSDWADLYIDGVFIHGWQWSLQSGGGAGANQLGAVDFFAGAAGGDVPLYYFDDVMFKTLSTDLYIDDFESYTVGNYIAVANTTWWTTWSGATGGGEDALISDDIASTTKYDVTIHGEVQNTTTGTYYCTIQDAIDAANANDVIEVSVGTYNEDLLINVTGLELRPKSGDAVTIKGVGTEPVTNWPLANPNIEILASGVEIHEFTIQSPAYVSGYYSSGIVIGAANVEIYDNDFEVWAGNDAGGDEISQAIQTYYKGAMPGVDISGLNIHDNTFTPLNSGTQWGYEGIYVNLDEGTGTITIADNDFSGELVRAITVERSVATISGNTIITDLPPYASPGALEGISIRYAGPGGPFAQSNIAISGNEVKGSGVGKGFLRGIRLGISGQTLSGITVTGNTLSGNTIGALVRSSANGVLINNNKITGNTTGVINEDASHTLNAENNWWGDATGPYHPVNNTCGLGNAVSNYIDFMPWWEDAGMTIPSGDLAVHNTDQDTYYCKIQDAIDDANADDVIEVSAGTYNEDLLINVTGLELKPKTGDAVTIKGVATMPIASWPVVGPNIEILASGVEIHEFTIQSPAYVSGYYSSGIVIGAANVEIYDNDFEVWAGNDVGGDEISQAIQTYYKGAMPGVDVSGLNIHDNTFTNLNSGTQWGYEGIYVNLDEGTATITIHDNQFTGELVRAITVERSVATISGNTIITDLPPYASPGALEGISIRYAGPGGPFAQSNIAISGNEVKGSGAGKGFLRGIRLGISGQTLTGITVTKNTLSGNTIGALVRSSANGVLIDTNKITGNTTGVINEDASHTLNAENNWWGDATGPYHPVNNTCGSGNAVSDYVDFMPWWTSETGGTGTLSVNNTTKGTYYCTIQDAIDDANANDVIEASAGTYNEQVRINKDVTLTSITGDYATGGVTIDPNGANYVEPIRGGTIAAAVTFETGSSGASLLGVTIQNSNHSSIIPNSGIEVVNGSIDNVVIGYVEVDGVSGNGIGSYHPDHTWPQPSAWTIEHCKFSTDATGTWSGMKPENMASLTIQDCEVGPTNYGGILLVNANGATVQRTVVHDVQRAGIQVDAFCTGAIDILDNEIYNANLSNTASYSDVRLYSTQINPHGYTPATITIEDNELRNGYHGIYVKSGDLTTRTGVTVHQNSIYSHTTSGITNDATGVLDAENNWWGNASGPYNNPYNTCGSGDAVVGNVDFMPWWEDSGMTTSSGDLPVYNTDQLTYYCKIQDAIDYANASDVIEVSAGTYNEDLLINVNGLELKPKSGDAVTINGHHQVTASNVTLTGFTLVNSTYYTIVLNSTAAALSNININSNTFTLIGWGGVHIGGDAGSVNQISNVTIDGNTFNGPASMASNPFKIGGFYGNPAGVPIDNIDFTDNIVNNASIPINLHNQTINDILIDDNTFRNTDGLVYVWETGAAPTGVLSNFVFTNNDADNTNSYGVVFGDGGLFSDANFGTGNKINDNSFDNIPGKYGYLGVSMVGTYSTYQLDAENNWWGTTSGPSHAGNTYTNPAGEPQGTAVSDYVDYVQWWDAFPGSSFAPVQGASWYSSIQAAIDAGGSPNTITCAAGSFTEDVDINKNQVTLNGANISIDPCTVARGTESIIVIINSTSTIDVSANNVTINGFTIQASATYGPPGGTMLAITGDNATVHYNILNTTTYDGSASAGISALWSSNASGMTIDQNKFLTDGGAAGWLSDGAADLYGGGGMTSHNVISNNCFTHDNKGGGYGLAISSDVGHASYYDVLDNTFSTYNSGIQIIDYTTTAGYGISEITIDGNTCNAGKIGILFYGIAVDGGTGISNVDVKNNTLTNNEKGIRFQTGATNIDIASILVSDKNTFSGNTIFGIENPIATTLDASENYWGSATPDFNSIISGDVDICDYYTDASFTTMACPPVTNVTQDKIYYAIQPAIDAANANDVIEVSAGTYNEQVRINKDVTLTSITGDYATGGVTIDPNGANYVEPIRGGTIAAAVTFETGSSGASLLGVTIQNSNHSSIIPNSGIEVVNGSIDNVVIGYVEVDGVSGNGIGSYHPDHTWPQPSAWTIEHCKFSTDATGTWSGMKPENMASLTIQDCEVGPTNYGGILLVNANGATVQRTVVHDVQRAGIQVDAFCTGAIDILDNEIYNANLSNTASYSDVRLYSTQINPHGYTPATITIEDNELRNGYHGIYVKSGDLTTRTGVTVHQNSIYSHTTSGITNDATGVLDAENNWWGNASGPYNNPYNTCGSGDAVVGNVDFMPWWEDSGMTTSSGDLPVYNTDQLTYYCKIQDAIDYANASDVIEVSAGTYNEDLLINVNGLELKPKSGDAVTIKGVGTEPVTNWPLANPNIEILASGVEIHEFTIQSPAYVSGYYSSGIVIGAANVEIYDNDFEVWAGNDAGGDEISQAIQTYYKGAMPGVDISGLNIHDNTFTPLNSGTQWGYEGIYVNLDEGTGTITIADNDFSGELVRAITVERSVATISGNTIITDLPPYASPGALEGISIRNLSSGGPFAQSNIAISGNEVKGSGAGNGFLRGIRLGITGQTLTGITVTDNTLSGNTIGALVRSSANGVLINNNKITGNTTGVINEDASHLLNAESNWWGDATGPNHPVNNSCGLGDAVSDYVDFMPWYTDAGMTTLSGNHPAISGSSSACAGSTGEVYTTPSYGGYFYLWNVAGGTIVSGQNTNQITVDWGNVDPGTVTVTQYEPVTFCAQTVSKTVTILPLPTPVVTGPATVVVNSTETYATTLNPTTAYTWNVIGGTITAGQNTNSITVLWPGTPGAGTVTVTELNLSTGCVGNSAPLNVTITSAGVKISGYFTYPNGANSPLVGLSLTLLNGATPVGTTSTYALGYYEFSGVLDGTYTIAANTTMTTGGVNSIDAGQVNLWWTSVTGIEKVRWYAGDVSDDDNIQATDAGQIQGHFAYGTSMARGEWTFWVQPDVSSVNSPSTNNLITVSGSDVTQDFYGLCVGDFNASNLNPGSKSGIASGLMLTHEGTIFAGPQMEFELPIKVASAMQVAALSLIIDIPSDLVSVEDVFINNGNNPVVAGALDFNVVGNELRIGWNSLTPFDYLANSTLLTLKLRTTKYFTDGQSIQLTLVPDPLNELADGQFKVIDDAILSTYIVEYSPTGIGDLDIAEGIKLECYPNPFKNFTLINYALPVEGEVKLEVYNMYGSRMEILVDETQMSGEYTIKFNTRGLPSGIYTANIRFRANGNLVSRTIKLVLNKN